MPPRKPITLIATLGGQPQVVTFALDALLADDLPVNEVVVIVLGPDRKRTKRSLARLSEEFKGDRYQGHSIRLRFYPIREGRNDLNDIYDETDADTAWIAINSLVSKLKAEHRTLHICVSGGRRILSLLTMSAAMLHFGHQDVLWHMYTPEAILDEAAEGALMHLPAASDFRLIRVPMMPWGSYFPMLRSLAQPPLHGDVLAQSRAALDAAERARCNAVLERLTERKKEILRAFSQGMTPQEVADHLCISIKTVDSHKTVILSECKNAWAIPEEKGVNYHFLYDKFETFFVEI